MNPRNRFAGSPLRLLKWEVRQDGKVEILRPKFGTNRFGKWVSSKLSKPYCRVLLDDYGSFVWMHCDGKKTVPEIAAALQAQSGKKIEDLPGRIATYFHILEKEKMIGWAKTAQHERV